MINSLFLSALTICWCVTLFSSAGAKAERVRKGDPPQAEWADLANNKVIPGEMEKVILTALSYYPSLKDTRIHFIYKEDIRKSVMQAQPKVSTLFRGKSKRTYVIKISRYLKLNSESLDITTLPFEVLVGWIAHELGHIIDYKDRSGLAMIGFGAKYWLFENFLKDAERRADLFALDHGLGDMIMETKNFVLNHADIPDSYKERIKRLYMSPEEFTEMLTDVAP
uniref:Uncharacterized protein n=1 Tax=Roseihalotalea indica TaxID=2867963 RepID=A0AA49GRM0_9BACT|nr:hypothetical protein K4G66_32365 [Tunicatimonas sp. TK19036]